MSGTLLAIFSKKKKLSDLKMPYNAVKKGNNMPYSAARQKDAFKCPQKGLVMGEWLVYSRLEEGLRREAGLSQTVCRNERRIV